MTRQSSGKATQTTRAAGKKTKNSIPVIAVLGYGGQGRALALNWRDAGYSVLVALRPRSRSAAKVKADHLPVVSFREAAVLAEVIVFAIPDHTHGDVFRTWFENRIEADTLLLFLHGTSITFGGVQPAKNQAVGLLAPHAPGIAVRSSFEQERPLSGFVAGNSAHTLSQVRTLASAMGIPKSHQLTTTMRAEAIGDLFGEQMVLCGGLAALVSTGFETLRESGMNSLHAWLEVGYQLDLIVALMKQYGIAGMFERISVAAQHGSVEVSPMMKKALLPIMKRRLREIESGRYPNRLLALSDFNKSSLESKTKKISSNYLEKAAVEVARLTKTDEVSVQGRPRTSRKRKYASRT